MILVILYSHKDLIQTVRLLKWIGCLSVANRNSMKKERLLLVPSRHASQRAAQKVAFEVAERAFKSVTIYIPEGEDERGWPMSPNFMFRSTLRYVEREIKDDVLWLEPDAIPLTPDWMNVVKREWELAVNSGKHFMGNIVHIHRDHMTGNGVYAKDWARFAPKIEQSNMEAWDTFAADQIVPNAHITPLIQHIFNNPKIDNLSILDPKAVIFHQDKKGKLIPLLDQELLGGVGVSHKFFNYTEIPQEEIVLMTKYYHADNSNRVIKSQGHRFIFEPYTQNGGIWMGTYSTDKEAEIVALDALVKDPRSAVTSLTKDQYEEISKKKAPNSTISFVQAQPQQPPQASIRGPTAVVVENPSPSPEPTLKASDAKDIDEILVVGKVVPASPPAQKPKPAGRRKEAVSA